MINFVCDNGTFEIQSSRESRNFNEGNQIRMVEVTVSSQYKNLDEIEFILTKPEMISSFSIKNEDNGIILGEFKDYRLNNISRSIQNNSPYIMISFSKGE